MSKIWGFGTFCCCSNILLSYLLCRYGNCKTLVTGIQAAETFFFILLCVKIVIGVTCKIHTSQLLPAPFALPRSCCSRLRA
ncbi:hypothetical protein XENTR_v10012767 [Xenopus tropicalis]|nr:hypothetical protein XENTR_v10012767 [Xenopus tropicalis]